VPPASSSAAAGNLAHGAGAMGVTAKMLPESVAPRADRAPPPPIPEWIALIRRLRDEGRLLDAKKELEAFRAAHADAERLLPPDLRDMGK
jgi:hypothetical protein